MDWKDIAVIGAPVLAYTAARLMEARIALYMDEAKKERELRSVHEMSPLEYEEFTTNRILLSPEGVIKYLKNEPIEPKFTFYR